MNAAGKCTVKDEWKRAMVDADGAPSAKKTRREAASRDSHEDGEAGSSGDAGEAGSSSSKLNSEALPQPRAPYQEGYCFYVVWDTLGMCSSKEGASTLDMKSGLTLAEIIDFRLRPEKAKKIGLSDVVVAKLTTATSLAASTTTNGGPEPGQDNDIERPELDPELFEYYLHYVDFDRRLDAWVSFDELVDVDTSEGRQATALRKHEKKEVPNPLTKKRDHSHGGMNETVAAFEREHEELTKVKNLDTVDLGSYRIEAWYYSPYPEQ